MTSLTSPSVIVLPSTYSSLQSSLLPTFRPLYGAHHSKNLNLIRQRSCTTCRAEFVNDAPIAVAIGGCILNSLVFPATYSPEDEDDEADSVIDSADARFAVMGIISFIPYFNWLSWIFAWLDTGKRRYAVYAIVYLAPYLRSNLSLSPEDSWLPIASILLCIGHIQLEASIKNGDFQGLNIFGETSKNLSTIARNKDSRISEEEETNDLKDLPSAQEQSRDEIRRWRNSRKPSRNPSSLNEDEEDRRGTKH